MKAIIFGDFFEPPDELNEFVKSLGYTKEELQMMWEEIDQPLTSANQIAVRLCECLSCENCPVVIYKCDHRTEYERTCLHEPCFGELHKWILENINNGRY